MRTVMVRMHHLKIGQLLRMDGWTWRVEALCLDPGEPLRYLVRHLDGRCGEWLTVGEMSRFFRVT